MASITPPPCVWRPEELTADLCWSNRSARKSGINNWEVSKPHYAATRRSSTTLNGSAKLPGPCITRFPWQTGTGGQALREEWKLRKTNSRRLLRQDRKAGGRALRQVLWRQGLRRGWRRCVVFLRNRRTANTFRRHPQLRRPCFAGDVARDGLDCQRQVLGAE